MTRIKYYGPNDLSLGSNLAQLENFSVGFSEDKEIEDINQAIEYFNVVQLIESGSSLLAGSTV